MKIRAYQPADEAVVIGLWEACGLVRPTNDPWKDIQRKLAVNPELFLVGEENGKIIGSVMVGYEGHRGWINYLAVDPSWQRRGYGRQLMAEAEKLLRARRCPKINLQVRNTNQAVIEFYQRIGYAIDEVTSLGRRLEQDGRKSSGTKVTR